jgi:hypothetical protein
VDRRLAYSAVLELPDEGQLMVKPLNAARARLLADMMPNDLRQILADFDKLDLDEVDGPQLVYLKEFHLVRRGKDLKGKLIWVLTPDGIKVRKAI